ncbi:winged helix-turn-helix transcriptional regulator [Dyadobacter jiangsuensis]
MSKRSQAPPASPRYPRGKYQADACQQIGNARQLHIRRVFDTFPPTVEYSITEHGASLEKVLEELHYWGLAHRAKIIG